MAYEYICPSCGHAFTKKFKFAQNPDVVDCPACGGLAVRWFGAVPSIHYKGQGWASKSEIDARDVKNDAPQDFSDLTGE